MRLIASFANRSAVFRTLTHSVNYATSLQRVQANANDDCLACALCFPRAVCSNSERLMRQATSVSRDTLLSLGTCFGKFTKSGKFRLHITALDYISQYAKVSYYVSQVKSS